MRSILFLLVLCVCQSAMADWPRFLGEHFDGVAQDELTIDTTTEPKLQWKMEVGDGYGLGVVSGDEYFHFDAIRRDALHERLRCFHLHTGEERWSVEQPIVYRDLLGYENGPRSTPAMDDLFIYTLGVSGQLNCRRRDNGELVWNVDTNTKYGVVQNFFGVGSSPLILGEIIVVMIGGSPPDDQEIPPMQLDRVSPSGSALVAFDRRTGAEKWRCGDDLASYSSPRTLSVDGQTFVLAFARTGLLMVDPRRGEVISRFDHRASKLESVNAMMPVVDRSSIFLSECYEVGSVLLNAERQTFKVVWQDPAGNRRLQAMRCHWATPILINGFLYGCSGRNAPDSDLRCVEWATGKVQWNDRRRTRVSVTQAGGILALLEERGKFQWVKPNPQKLDVMEEYDLSETHGLRFPCWAAPVIVGDKMLLRGDTRVYCFQLSRQSLPEN